MRGRGGTSFRVIPAVDLKGGKVVRLRQGRPEEVTVELEDPVGVARMWVEKGAKALHVIDLDGAFGGRLVHEGIIRDIVRLGVEVQVGGGIREEGVVRRLIGIGVSRVILGTLAVRNPKLVMRLAEEFPGRIMIAVDSRRDFVRVEGWMRDTGIRVEELIRIYDPYDVSFLYTNIDVEGLVRGAEIEKIERVVSLTDNPVYVAGGISSKEEVVRIREVGAAGVVIGSALYKGKVRLEELLEVER